METTAGRRPSSENMPSSSSGGTANPFKTALHKFAQRTKERSVAAGLSNAATSSFFTRGQKLTAHPKAQALPGSIKQVTTTGQLPPVWATPAPAPSRWIPYVHTIPSSVDAGSPRVQSVSSADTQRDHARLLQKEEGTIDDIDDTCTEANSDASRANPPRRHMENQERLRVPPTTARASASFSRNASVNLRYAQFERLLEQDVVDLDQLRKLSWGGIPPKHRPIVWRLLLNYMPSKRDRQGAMLARKRQEYVELLQQYYYIPDAERGTREQTTLRQILVDIPRTNADVKLFQSERIHQCMERVLYLWAIRHPASGYVQGINDLMTPFLVVFLSAYIVHTRSRPVTDTNATEEPQTGDVSTLSDQALHLVEADSYWCLTKLLDDIQDHYTFAQPGLQRMVQRMEELVHRCDADLFAHIVGRENVEFVQFAFRWMNCLLMRELPLTGIVRIWDTYLCEDSGFESFHVYVCAALLMTFGDQLKTLEFQDLVLFLQSLPTTAWRDQEIEPLLSRAYILQTYFADAPSHLSSQAAAP
ncbi:hypothetical protein PsorP6_014884 [Peronosclerospora sorghi]|uniref:Uncharacterized protein n=1 Tax=Peronosclerospora sorghi TaxID=230839 RepID=A0ACC0VR81_9STRA|nr:hypothetical protein PsorP6_014884 [Peronosclerospora sorghi]